MKATKIFALAMAALAFVACNKPEEVTPLELSDVQIAIKAGETHQLTANIKVDAWETSNAEVATVADGLVTAVAEGTAIITAKAGTDSKSCVVKVEKAGGNGGNGGGATMPYKRVWAVVLDQVTYEANASIMAGDARVDDVENHLYIWPDGSTYAAGDGVGKNAMGNDEGYVALTCTSAVLGWSGLGFCIEKAESVAALEELRQAILANPDNFFFHLALKATDSASHKFYVFNEGVNGFTIGTTEIDGGAIFGDYTRDGKWHEIEVPMSKFTATLQTPVKAGDNIFCALSGNQPGAQLNFDAVYFYEK